VDVLDVAPVEVAVAPLLRQHRLGRDVGAGDDVAHAVLRGHLVEEREDRVVGRHLAVRSRRLQERDLEVAELLPVDDVRVQVDAEGLQRLLDVGDRELGVPAVVEVDGERSEPEVLDEPGDVRAVHATADADHAVVGLALARSLDLGDEGVEAGLALGDRNQPLAGDALVAVAVAADAGGIERDVGVGRVHDAADTGLAGGDGSEHGHQVVEGAGCAGVRRGRRYGRRARMGDSGSRVQSAAAQNT
jgi:hypothetical protein